METTLGKLYIAKSTLSGVGQGLFTSVKIKKGEKICEFEGPLIGTKEFAKVLDEIKKGTYNLIAANYYVSLSSGLLIDSYNSDCFARYANDAEGLKKVAGLKNNAKIIEGEDEISAYLEATKDIPEGGEIFTSYGKAYWKDFTS